MFFTSNPGRGKNPQWGPAFCSKLLCCFAFALLLLAVLPSVSWAATFGLGGNLGTSSSSNPITETDIRAGKVSGTDITLTLTLVNNTWADDVVANSAKLNTLIDCFAAKSETDQWNLVKSALKADPTKIIQTSSTVITITLPSISGYDISTDQAITVNIASSLLSDSSNPAASTASFTIIADSEATLSSTIASATDIVKGNKKITIILTNDTWTSDIITNTKKRDMFFDSLSASSSIASNDSQWNTGVVNALKAAPDPSKVLALSNSNSTLTITLPAVPDYQITALQTITVRYNDTWATDPQYPIITDKIIAQPNPLTFTIDPAFSSATLGGNIASGTITEAEICAGNVSGTNMSITLTLGNNTWAADVVSNSTKLNTLIDSFVAKSDSAQWDKVKIALKANPILSDGINKAITLSSDKKVITIILPNTVAAIPTDYNISADQIVTLTIPATLLAYNYPVTITPNTFTIKADRAAAVSGTVTPSLTELDITTGGKSITITLTGETWKKDVITDTSLREALIAGLCAAGADSSQWNSTALDTIKANAVFTRVSDTVVSISLPPVAGFNIASSLVVSLTVPGTAVTGGLALPNVPAAFTISQVSTQSAKLSGTAISDATEADIASGGKTIIITLNKDVWAANVAANQSKRDALIDGFSATGTASSQWDTLANILKTNARSDSTVVVRTSDTVVTITLPVASNFKLSDDITISLNIPNTVLTTATSTVKAAPSFTISAITAVLAGTAIDSSLDSSSIVAGGKTITITLNNATWVSDVITNNLSELIDGFAGTNSADWNLISAAIMAKPANVIRTSNTVITIKLPPVPGYSSTRNSSVSLIIPADLITGGNKDVAAAPDLTIGSASSAKLTGTALSASKSEIIDGDETIIITLNSGTWATDVVSASTKLNALLKGFVADSDTADWDLVIAAIKADSGSVVRSSDTVITITLPPVPGYDIIADQTVKLTIPKSVLTQSSADMIVKPALTITIPDYTSQGTLQSLLDSGSFADYVNGISLQDIYLAVPVKYITSVVAGQTTLGNTVVTSLDIYTDSSVDTVKVTVNGATYTSNSSVTYGKGNKFNIGFSYANSTTASSSSKPASVDAVISALGSDGRQSDTIKISGSKTYTLAPTADLHGAYSLYKLVKNSSLLTNILKFYTPAEIIVQIQ